MGATLDALCRLQEVELQITEINGRIERKRRMAVKQEKRIADLEAKMRARKDAIRQDQMEADRLDLDVKVHEAEIAKLRQALNVAKTNKEYSAILTQLNTNKADNSKVEERVLAIFNQVEAKRKAAAAAQEELDREVAKLEELKAAWRETEDKAKDRLAALLLDREAAAEAVPASVLDVFNRVARKHEGGAMAQIVRTHPKRSEYACEGCNMAVTIEQVNSILSRDDPTLCNSCGRILFYESPTASRAR